MEIINYSAGDPWTGTMQCPSCGTQTHAWRSSGMSDLRPHFYCDTCSNGLCRESDWGLVYERGATAEVLAQIEPTLPACPCGGQFRPGANPKCPSCGAAFSHQNDPVRRLNDPQMILVDGACSCKATDGPVAVVKYRVEFLKEA